VYIEKNKAPVLTLYLTQIP